MHPTCFHFSTFLLDCDLTTLSSLLFDVVRKQPKQEHISARLLSVQSDRWTGVAYSDGWSFDHQIIRPDYESLVLSGRWQFILLSFINHVRKCMLFKEGGSIRSQATDRQGDRIRTQEVHTSFQRWHCAFKHRFSALATWSQSCINCRNERLLVQPLDERRPYGGRWQPNVIRHVTVLDLIWLYMVLWHSKFQGHGWEFSSPPGVGRLSWLWEVSVHYTHASGMHPNP